MQKTDVVKALRDEGFVVTEWTDPPNAGYEAHTHRHREVRIVLAGEITFVAGGVRRTLGPGDRIDFQPDEAHAARVGPDGAPYLAGRR
jgi:quercetin dioxygenase-like cupin family protein